MARAKYCNGVQEYNGTGVHSVCMNGQGEIDDKPTASTEFPTIFVFSEPQPNRLITATTVSTSPWSRNKVHRLYYERALAPFHASLRLFGLLFEEDSRNKRNFAKWYHWFVKLASWFNFLRFFGAYEPGEYFGFLVTCKLIVHGVLFWGVAGTVAASIMATQRPIIFEAWYSYRTKFNQTHSSAEERIIKRRVLAVLLTNWAILLANCAVFIFVFGDQSLVIILRVSLLPFVGTCDENYVDSIFAFVIIFCVNLFNMSICGFQLGYLLLMVIGITDEFAKFNREFQNDITVTNESVINLEWWRKRHLDLSTLVEAVDKAFGLHILLLFLTNIAVCSFLVFIIVSTMSKGLEPEGTIYMLAIFTAYLVLSIGILFVITYAGTKLNTQATACKSYLYSLELKGEQWTMERSLQYMTFYNKLTEGHIGITGWKLFYINKLTTKTVILMIVSYSVILLKFGQSGSDPPFHCPETPSNVTDMVATTTGY